MHPVLLELGKFKFYTYGLFVAIGFIAAVTTSRRLAKPYHIAPETVSDIYFVILISAMIGARSLYVFIAFDDYKDNLMDIFRIWNGGFVFFGGFIASVIGVYGYIRLRKLNLWQTADILAPGVALGHAFGRVGCFFAGCCYGKQCDLPFAVKFTHPDTLAPMGVYLHPTQLYSVISNLVVFLILVVLTKRKSFDGMVFLIYIMLYSLFRSGIEFFRGDYRGNFFFDFISLSQGIGFLVSVIALILLVKLIKRHHGTG